MQQDYTVGEGSTVSSGAIVGAKYTDDAGPATIGDRSTIRYGTVIYGDVAADNELNTGHYALIREQTTLGANVLVGTNTVIDGQSDIGSDVSLQTDVYIPTQTQIEDRVFIGPGAVLTNDPYPVRQDIDLTGPTLKNDVSIGANATLLPDVTIGERAVVAAGAVVTDDVPPDTLAVGNPVQHEQLPAELEGENDL
ncbi:DapH/DapD/GlmU-related protein [Halobacterium salinarum]|uniref:N-acetyltransferase n=1 Tax=Halobacterium salinarum TaxID=2242 RepID=UPI002553B8B3|nr:N-acetyltransferase [Halobacterium salinarum]MDL0125105.1 DapH/DapD/GlmU-related protein [Halobacterium salinarum]